MNLDNINALALGDLKDISSLNSGVSARSFLDQLLTEISSVNNKLEVSEAALQDLAAGKSNNIHHVMLALEDAKLSFQLMVQVRNKLLEGYQDILRMQI